MDPRCQDFPSLDDGEVIVPMTATVEYNGRWDTDADAEFVDAETDTTGDGDPGFVDAENDDYRLLATSDAVDAGVPISDEPYRGSAPDLGYDEYETPGVICMII